MKKINEITFSDLYNNQDLCMDILLDLYDQDIKKANKKANKKAKDFFDIKNNIIE